MHRTVLRFLAVALLALAIPIQGWAAVTAGQCMALGHHQDGAGEVDHAHAQDAVGHDHAAHSHAGEGATGHGDDGGKQPHCGPCAACCASASIAGAAASCVVPSACQTPYVLAQFPPIGVHADALYRPPLAL
jgi:hypothetical protein